MTKLVLQASELKVKDQVLKVKISPVKCIIELPSQSQSKHLKVSQSVLQSIETLLDDLETKASLLKVFHVILGVGQ